MDRFVYKTRSDGLAVLNIGELDKRLRYAANMINISKRVLIVCRKEIGEETVKKFSKVLGYREIAGRFMPGTLTNPSFKDFYEPELTIIVDPISDRQAIKESVKMRIPIIALCDTVHNTAYIDLVLPCNNKGKKSISLVFWALAKIVKEMRGEEFTETLEDFGWEQEKKPVQRLREEPQELI